MKVKESDVFKTCRSLLPVSQSVQYTSSSSAPSDILCGTRSFCAGGFQAVTVLPAPPLSNTNFPHLNLKGFTANRLQSTVYWIQWHKQLSRASRQDHLLGYCFYWCQTNTKCRSAVGWNAFTGPRFQVYSIPKASVWNLGCLCWEYTSYWLRTQHVNSLNVFGLWIFFWNLMHHQYLHLYVKKKKKKGSDREFNH